MRHVDLTAEGPLPQSVDPLEVEKRTAHLNARMSELLADGLRVASGMESDRVGVVNIAFPNLESGPAAEVLRREYQIESGPITAGGMLHFRVSVLASFEDMDYVQGAVAELLYD